MGVYYLLAVDDDRYLVRESRGQISVSSIFSHIGVLSDHHTSGVSEFEFLATKQLPKTGVKEQRVTFRLDRDPQHGAKAFASRVLQKFNLLNAQQMAARMGVHQ